MTQNHHLALWGRVVVAKGVAPPVAVKSKDPFSVSGPLTSRRLGSNHSEVLFYLGSDFSYGPIESRHFVGERRLGSR